MEMVLLAVPFSCFLGIQLLKTIVSMRVLQNVVVASFGIVALIAWSIALRELSAVSASDVDRSESGFSPVWIRSGDLLIRGAMEFDATTTLLAAAILSVAALTLGYALWFNRHEERASQDTAYCSLLIFAAVLTLGSDGLTQVVLGWYLASFSTIKLIAAKPEEEAWNAAAARAFIINRFGDTALLLAVFVALAAFGSSSFETLSRIDIVSVEMPRLPVFVITALILAAILIKSAQIGAHVVLSDVAKAHVPVASIMLVATIGVIALTPLFKLEAFFEGSPSVYYTFAVVGLLSSVFVAFLAAVERDLHRITAYIAGAQAGLILAVTSLGFTSGAAVMLLVFMFAQVALSLVVGLVVRAAGEENDVTRLGGLRARLPLSYMVILAASTSMLVAPVLAGFYDHRASGALSDNLFVAIAFLAALCVLSFSLCRASLFVFHGKNRLSFEAVAGIHPPPSGIAFLVCVLAAGGLLVLVMFAGLVQSLSAQSSALGSQGASLAFAFLCTLAVLVGGFAAASSHRKWTDGGEHFAVLEPTVTSVRSLKDRGQSRLHAVFQRSSSLVARLRSATSHREAGRSRWGYIGDGAGRVAVLLSSLAVMTVDRTNLASRALPLCGLAFLLISVLFLVF